MKFQVGDKVVIQHSNDEGEVVEIINDKMVLVDVRGVRFPAHTDQLDFPYFKRFSQKRRLLLRRNLRNTSISCPRKNRSRVKKKNGSPNLLTACG